ncbi:putative Quinate dehydrogenase [Drepanopeziza brunnea f. sp. 'multigermtubi' MB_m1]|uniref:Putative Quinate dehydrogenase n=1 Tax=Marssonina brunnea f. sp. multigermtubi (strain MB_m1) TaxID=1072389 RepID=K1XLM1_MARBU|nr:putative Quinate dehydrogenase [Drepanopeziza brunnea f. sp. 'multigermtubi' MB_m1]EKD21463.1 putative Quinate dehydrogenase [Drepanopeziza brunnea f. sp. 'multigermtubi' MB_m1]
MSQHLGNHEPPPDTDPYTPPPAPSISHLDRVAYLFGYPIAHSLSPLLHSTVYSGLNLNYEYILYESKSIESCLALTTHPKFYGAAVTMPHKVAIIPFLDVLTPEAEAIGAVNTIFLSTAPPGIHGRRLLCGTNTDCIGIREAILQNTSPSVSSAMRGQPGMVVGGGGTCRAAVYALKHFLGCSDVYLVNRDPVEIRDVIDYCTAKGFGSGLREVASVAEARALPGPRVVVSAIPDLAPRSEAELRTRAVVEVMLGKQLAGGKGCLLDMCYHPNPDTAISRLAGESGWRVIGGVEAMIWQGLEQDKIWLRRRVSTLPVEEVERVFASKEPKEKARL